MSVHPFAPPQPLPDLCAAGHVRAEVRGRIGFLTLNRPGALNALSLPMVRDLTTVLLHWAADPAVLAVVLQGQGREGKPPALCAGGDIRFFHQAALAGDPRLEDFFTEEYALNHLIHRYPKPYVAVMDGITMGGGMGISQGASLRIVTEHSRLAMPETHIGLFPDVGGGWFLSRCPGHVGEYLAMTGETLGAAEAIEAGLADVAVRAADLPALLARLGSDGLSSPEAVRACAEAVASPPGVSSLAARREAIDLHFSLPTLARIAASLAADTGDFARHTLAALHKRSPLMLAVALEQIRRARTMTLADDLRMERDLVRHCFHLRPGTASETVEGIRALVIDKDHHPRWNPSHLDGVVQAEVDAFFVSPWPAHVHPLRALA
ncbi:enoyl-CoA hydratase/isomerase family protein [Sphaerotilus sp.]|uniref:enoyl-CoA hydratase/isomerase family protein n=1 Tax=Sphaerotilus sp. TaxID=2093942 RepID=UPI002ACE7E5A|nr:enoyl-CoA hydratase/isomerase family protein [Sphaerotilus sp.]MDZ7855576.1 enoyl-CoA hydratase/isomerase family protein [Sphaerotilus sp.]